MGLGKIARGAGKVGLALEAAGYIWQAGSALWRMVRGARSKQRADSVGDAQVDPGQHSAADQDRFSGP